MRKYKLPDELAQLSEDDLMLVNSWLRRFTYTTVQEKCLDRFQINININKLCRYYQRLGDVEDLNRESGHALTVDDLNKLKNGQPLPDGKINKRLIDYACFKMAQRPDQTPAELYDIFRIATHEQEAEFTRSRLEIANRFADLREQKQALKLLEMEYLAKYANLPAPAPEVAQKSI